MGCACGKGRDYVVKDEFEQTTIGKNIVVNDGEIIERVTYMFLDDIYRSVKIKFEVGI